jgi:hypothetical protein
MSMILAFALTAALTTQVEASALLQPSKRPLGPTTETIVPKRLPNGEPSKRSCLSQAETRETVVARKLFAPYLALRAASARAHGETIGVRLCRLAEVLVYDVTVLRRDGRVVKVIIDAASGRILHTINDH